MILRQPRAAAARPQRCLRVVNLGRGFGSRRSIELETEGLLSHDGPSREPATALHQVHDVYAGCEHPRFTQSDDVPAGSEHAHFEAPHHATAHVEDRERGRIGARETEAHAERSTRVRYGTVKRECLRLPFGRTADLNLGSPRRYVSTLNQDHIRSLEAVAPYLSGHGDRDGRACTDRTLNGIAVELDRQIRDSVPIGIPDRRRRRTIDGNGPVENDGSEVDVGWRSRRLGLERARHPATVRAEVQCARREVEVHGCARTLGTFIAGEIDIPVERRHERLDYAASNDLAVGLDREPTGTARRLTPKCR